MISSADKANQASKTEVVFVADLGGTHLRAAVVESTGKIQYQLREDTPQTKKPDEIVRALVAAARKCEEISRAKGSCIRAVAVAVPGTVDIVQGVVRKAPNLPHLDGFNLTAALQTELRWPAILENDANAAAVGERWQGAGKDSDTVICLTLGTGVGGGIILDGELWRGADGSAGEIGHMAVDPFGGVACPCGSTGCLEVYASATAIVRMTREMKPRYTNSPLQTSELTAKTIYDAGTQGDELALEVFKKMGVYLGIGLASLVNLLNPEVIVLAGGVANGWSLFESPMRQQVMDRAFPIPARTVRVVQGQCGDDAGLLGAAHLAFAGQAQAS